MFRQEVPMLSAFRSFLALRFKYIHPQRFQHTHTHNNYHYGEEEEEKLRGSKGSWGALLLYVTCKRVLSLFTDRIVRRLDIFYHFLWLIQVRFRPF